MKFRPVLAVSVAIGLLLPGAFSYGQSRRLAFSIQAGGAGHEENNLNVALAGGLSLTVPMTKRLSVTAEIDYWNTGSQDSSYRKLNKGRLAVTPILLGVKYEFEGNGYFTPYAVAGAGYVGTKFHIGSPGSIPEVTIDQSVRSGWAAFFGGGVLWHLSAFWDFFTEIDYLIRTAPAQTVTCDQNLGTTIDDIWVNLHVVYWKFGLRFLF